MRSILLIGLALLLGTPAHAVRVALLEIHVDGKRMELEPAGRFAHVAIEVEPGLWLHAFPGVDVELTREIEDYGVNLEVFENPAIAPPTREQVRRYLDKIYNLRLEWSFEDGTTYNARLVGELLGLAPKPAYYMAEIWRDYAPYGMVGLSPDDIHHALVADLGFTRVDCVRNLETVPSRLRAARFEARDLPPRSTRLH